MNIENPERRFSALPSELRKNEESDVEKARRRRREREGVKDESINEFEEKLKSANEKIGATDTEREIETEEETLTEAVEGIPASEVEFDTSFLIPFKRLSEEVEKLNGDDETSKRRKEEVLKELKEFVGLKTGVDISNPQEKMNLEDSLIAKLRKKMGGLSSES